MNVLLITADQWRGECLGGIGHSVVQTPSLDSLGSDGTTFTQHFSQASPCGPARASLLTGMYQHNHRVLANGVPLDIRFTNIALEARKVGLEPVLFGYTDVTADPRGRDAADPALRRIDDVLPGMTPIVRMDDEMFPWISHLLRKGYQIPSGEYGVFQSVSDDNVEPDPFGPALFKAEDSATAFLIDAVIDYVRSRVSIPWFIHLSLLAPHPPFIVPAPYHGMYNPGSVPKPVRAVTPDLQGQQHPYTEALLKHQQGTGIYVGHSSADNLKLSDQDIARARATYYAMITEVDYHIGRLLAFLKEQNVYSDTLIIFTSDHGEQLGDHWQFAKYGYYDSSFHIPLLIRMPGSAYDGGRNRVIGDFTENVDVMPTILAALGIELPIQCNGTSLTPLLRGLRPSTWRECVHWEFDFAHLQDHTGSKPMLGLRRDQCGVCVARGKRYKYIHFSDLPPLLFDLAQDPYELNNLAVDTSYSSVIAASARDMVSWRMHTEDCELSRYEVTRDGLMMHNTSGPR